LKEIRFIRPLSIKFSFYDYNFCSQNSNSEENNHMPKIRSHVNFVKETNCTLKKQELIKIKKKKAYEGDNL